MAEDQPENVGPARADREAAVQPRRVWQWLLMFPAAIIPLYTAIPVWMDKALALYHDYRNGSYKDSQEQIQLAYRNMDCLRAPYSYYTNPTRLKIDGTICKSGDILVRAQDGLERQAVYFLPVSLIQDRIEASAPQHVQATAAADSPVEMSADENGQRINASLITGFGNPMPAPRLYQAQYPIPQVRVIRSWPMPGNPRYLIQRIMRPDGCFDQVIDLANGGVVQVMRAPCQ